MFLAEKTLRGSRGLLQPHKPDRRSIVARLALAPSPPYRTLLTSLRAGKMPDRVSQCLHVDSIV